MNEISEVDKNEVLDENDVKKNISQALLGMANDESSRVRSNLNSLSALENKVLEMMIEKVQSGDVSTYEMMKLINIMNTSVNRSVNVMKMAMDLGEMMSVVINNTYNTQNNTVNVAEISNLDKDSRERIRKFLSAANIMEENIND